MKIILFAATFVLFAVFSQGGVQKCWFCHGNCMDYSKRKEKMCESDDDDDTDYLCYSWSLIEPGKSYVTTERKCVPNTEKIKKDCRRHNKANMSSCSTCDIDLCNDIIKAEETFRWAREEEEGNKKYNVTPNNVKKCYHCSGDCMDDQKLEVEICKDGDNKYGYLCYALSKPDIFRDGHLKTERKCVSNTGSSKKDCQERNELYMSSCYTCDSDLCNKVIQAEEDIKRPAEEDKKKRAEEELRRKEERRNLKCYVCEGKCEQPEEKKCDIEGATEYSCLARATRTEYGDVTEKRNCVSSTNDEIIKDCNAPSDKEDHGCYLCDTKLCNYKPALEAGLKCYVCEGKCEQPKKRKCGIKGVTEYSCQATAIRTYGGVTEIRNCVSRTNETIEQCKAMHDRQGHDCYLCDTMLCNNRPALEGNGTIDSVQKCYFCEWGSCENPKIVSCDETRPTDFLCMSVSTRNIPVTGRAKPYLRQCVGKPNNRIGTSWCAYINFYLLGGRCYTCSTNLCNKQAEGNYLYPPDDDGVGPVKECYTCCGQCDQPRKEKCNVRRYLCMEARTTTYDGTALYERMCVPKTDIQIESCRERNQLPGSSCHICDKDLCNNEYSERPNRTDRPDMERPYNTAAIYSPQAMLLTTLISQFVTKLSRM